MNYEKFNLLLTLFSNKAIPCKCCLRLIILTYTYLTEYFYVSRSLSNNQISNISPQAFEGLSALQSL
jgi:hypothetical protein